MKTDDYQQVKLMRPIPRMPAALAGELWGITTYFNPAGYLNKLEHLRLFSERVRKQGLKLLIVELAFGDAPYVLEESLADRIIRVRSNSILWQKERLLNIAIEQLPEVCDKVAWLDADILFENDDWIGETTQLLQKYVVVQPFHQQWPLSPEAEKYLRRGSIPESIWKTKMEYGAAYKHVQNPAETMLTGDMGHAWAARRSLLRTHGLYERNILGGGDVITALAMFGYFKFESTRDLVATYTSQAQLVDVLKWMERFHADAKGSIFYTEGSIFHMWHGTHENRRYQIRSLILKEVGFDPHADISLDQNKCWQWSSDKPELHRRAREYFWSRKEEDEPVPADSKN
jgi:hypothetical protein